MKTMKNLTSHSHVPPAAPQKGFTLPELMLTVMILAILLGIGVPSFKSLMGKQELKSKVSLFTSTLAYARNEAVSRVASVAICGSNGSGSCSGSSDLSNGWLVFIDKDGNGTFNSGDELLKQGGESGDDVSITLASSATYILYSALGESSSVRNIHMCASENTPENSRTVTISIVGSTRVSTGATCPSNEPS